MDREDLHGLEAVQEAETGRSKRFSVYVHTNIEANKLKTTCHKGGIERLLVVIIDNKFIHLTFIGLAAPEIKDSEPYVPHCRDGDRIHHPCFYLRVRVCSVMSDSFVTPWTVVHQAPLSRGLSRRESWSGLSFPPPGDLLNPGIEPASLATPALAGGFFTTDLPRKPPCFSLFILSSEVVVGQGASMYIFTHTGEEGTRILLGKWTNVRTDNLQKRKYIWLGKVCECPILLIMIEVQIKMRWF